MEEVPQAALGVLLDMFYGLSALRQVPPLAASEGAQAVVPVELSKEQLTQQSAHAGRMCGNPGLLSA